MKVLILGDNHFGRGYNFGRPESESGINSRLLDYKKTLADIITYAIDSKIELFIFLGDIFETRHPTSQQMVVFYRQLRRLSYAGITTYIVVGNHDAILSRRLSSSLDPLTEIQLPKVSIYTELAYIIFMDSNDEVLNVILMPYRNRQSYNKETNDEALAELSAELSIAQSKLVPGAPTLLCGHMMLENTIPSDAGEMGLNELILPYSMFDGIDITIHGHIHRSSVVQENPPIIYSGSMECNDFSEREHKKSFIIYDTQKKGMDAITFRPINTRKFIDFEIDYASDFPADPNIDILEQMKKQDINDAVVRMNIRVPENKVGVIELSAIRSAFYDAGVSCISDISISPVITKQLRNQKINDAPDDISAFKHYVHTQNNIDDEVLRLGLGIMMAEIEE
jgi:exonuclease SbcD